MSHPVVGWQIITPEPDGATRFYGQLFDWPVRQDNALGYREVRSGGIDGGVWPAPPGVKPFVQLHVQVADVDACITKATSLGATVVVPRTALPEGDEMAVLLDPFGMALAIRTPRRAG